MSGSTIKRRLRAHGFWPLGWPYNNGIGPRTVKQIKKFQAAHGLEVDGVVGPLTSAALNAPATRQSSGERAKAVNWAKSRVGVVEHPANSNRGPYITEWSELSGYPGAGVPWCQNFANASAYVGTGKRFKPSQVGGYTVSVVELARNGEHGLRLVSLDAARPGDWVYFNFPGGDSVDHVGLFMHRDGNTVYTIEGNTSPEGSGGSDSNGGGVFRRSRNQSLIAHVVCPPFKN